MKSLEEIQIAIDAEREGAKPGYPDWLKEGPKNALNYIDLIINQNSKLSSIIACLAGCSAESAELVDFDRLGAAMLDYTDAINKHASDFNIYLNEIGMRSLEESLNLKDKKI